METVFPIFQGDPGLEGPPGMHGRNGDDVSDIDAQDYGFSLMLTFPMSFHSFEWLHCMLFAGGSWYHRRTWRNGARRRTGNKVQTERTSERMCKIANIQTENESTGE